MVDLFQYRSWAISESYFSLIAPRIARMMLNGHSLDSIIKKQSIEDFMPRIHSLLNTSEEGKQSGPVAAVTRDTSSGLPVINQNNKNIALIPVIGALTKYGGMCSYGMQDYQSMISKANESPNVDGIVLIMDSPGGTVDGTPEFGMAIRDSKKPLGVFGDNMVASAALWAASQADVIVGNKNNPTEFGSIGTLMVTENWQKMMEAGREPQIEIMRAPQSTDKALVNPIEPMTDEIRSHVSEDLRGITDMFIGAVKSGRGDVLNKELEGLFNGRMFDVNTSLKNGVIDSAGTLQTAVNKVAEIAKQRAKEGTNQTKNKSANTMKFPKLSSLFGGKSKEGKEVNMKVSSEGLESEDTASLEAAEQKVAEMEGNVARLTEENAAKEAKISELNASVTSLTTENTTLTAKVTELQGKVDAKAAGEKTTVIQNEDKSEVKTSYETSVDREAKAIRESNQNLSTRK